MLSRWEKLFLLHRPRVIWADCLDVREREYSTACGVCSQREYEKGARVARNPEMIARGEQDASLQVSLRAINPARIISLGSFIPLFRSESRAALAAPLKHTLRYRRFNRLKSRTEIFA